MLNNKYCLITGASEGLGKAMAIECAARKMNLILVARTGSVLVDLANFIKRACEVDIITIEKDLYKEENCIALFDEVSALNISVNMLINNAGTGSTLLFTEGSFLQFQKQIQLNILATTLITRLFIAKLQQNSPAHILNVGSLSCFFFLTKKQVYGATKSYVYYFSKSLRRELQPEGINVSVVCPGCINTNPETVLNNQSVNWLARLSVMNPQEVAFIAIDGLLKRKEVIIPGRLNKFFLLLNILLPSFVSKRITDRQMKRLGITATRRNHLFEASSHPHNKIVAG